MGLQRYYEKRDFSKTPEPKGRIHSNDSFHFYIQKHKASHLHYDFRLELDGVLKSWAVPKGPSLDPKVKRLAINVEDHPLEYGSFEGIIPKGEYGGGTVMLWDEGNWKPLDDNPLKAYKNGHLRFELKGKRLVGRWDLIRFKKEDNAWFLVKYNDKFAKNGNYDITKSHNISILTGHSMDEIVKHHNAIWTQNGLQKVKNKIIKPEKLNLPIAKMPEPFTPELATLVDEAPEGNEWLHEVKFDGYRILAFKKGNKVSLYSRNKKEWTKEFQDIADEIKKLAINNVIIDGEVVMIDEKQRTNFQLLQNTLKGKKNKKLIYYAFDLLFYEKHDTRSLPLIKRKELLKPLLLNTLNIHYSEHIIGQGNAFYKKACEFELEGIISKLQNSEYVNKRSKAWLKVKCSKRQEFVIGGFTPPKNSRSSFGSLYLGVYDNKNNFIYVGNVGTGFTQDSLKDIYIKLIKIITLNNPFNSNPPGYTSATWVKPELVAEVEFSQWTAKSHLRHPSFKGLRLDKKAKFVKKEETKNIDDIEKNLKKNELQITRVRKGHKLTQDKLKSNKISSTIKLTNPDKILYPEDKITKADVFYYYEQVAEYILPFIKNRPLTLVRCPLKYNDCFYQKKLHSDLKYLYPIAIKDSTDNENYFYIKDIKGLLSLVQMGTLEIHPWGSTIKNIEKPDIITIDLDPGDDLKWKDVVSAAFDVKKYFAQLNLKSFVKTTGGKGLHVVIPLKPQYDWEAIKNFTHHFVQTLEELFPDKYISKMAKSKRKGKIFVDYLRNQRGATAIAAYSTRARVHAPVSVPLDWDELSNNIKDNYFTIKTLPKRLENLNNDPWNDFFKIKQHLTLKI